MVNETTFASWSAGGGLCFGVAMFTGPTRFFVGSERTREREAVCADAATVQTNVTAISAVMDSL
jgi:hypothetical protein